MKHPLRLEVSVDRQTLRVLRGRKTLRAFPVSTAAKGVGFRPGSHRTPCGRFLVCEKIGAGAPPGTIFKAREPVGVWTPGDAAGHDLVLTRILRLEGIERRNRNTRARFIYLHGTDRETLVGTPASMGCVRLRNADMIELFDLVPVGTGLTILPPAAAALHHSQPQRRSIVIKRSQPILLAQPSFVPCVPSVMSAKKSTGTRYPTEKKTQVIAFVKAYNSKNGRGGQAAAAKKFGITPLTVSHWMHKLGSEAQGKGAANQTAANSAKLREVARLAAAIATAQAGLARDQAKLSQLMNRLAAGLKAL